MVAKHSKKTKKSTKIKIKNTKSDTGRSFKRSQSADVGQKHAFAQRKSRSNKSFDRKLVYPKTVGGYTFVYPVTGTKLQRVSMTYRTYDNLESFIGSSNEIVTALIKSRFIRSVGLSRRELYDCIIETLNRVDPETKIRNKKRDMLCYYLRRNDDYIKCFEGYPIAIVIQLQRKECTCTYRLRGVYSVLEKIMTNFLAPLKCFAELPAAGEEEDQMLRVLADLAESENWSSRNRPHSILYQYLLHTFSRIRENDNHILYDNDGCCFNTGLVSKRECPIFMYFKRQDKNSELFYQWKFDFFDDNVDFAKNRFGTVPPIASYGETHDFDVLTNNFGLSIEYHHILNNNYSRFPQSIRSLLTDEKLDSAIEESLRHLRSGEDDPVYQFYRKRDGEGTLQLLLPIRLDNTDTVHAVLSIYYNPETEKFRVVTVLDTRMAYNNARLVKRPKQGWVVNLKR